MTKYALLCNDDGTLINHWAYTEETWPPADIVQPGQLLVEFTESTENFEILHAMFLTDATEISSQYLTPGDGGVTYNTNTQKFEFHKPPIVSFSLLESIREHRNILLAQTDDNALVPDYPDALKAELLAYRTALRDITTNLDPSWTTLDAVVWPVRPDFI